MNNKLYIAAAGAGKTTFLIKRAIDLLKNDNDITDEELTFINKLIEERNVAKLNKDYKRADEIRDELKKMNIIIKDTREGTMFERI